MALDLNTKLYCSFNSAIQDDYGGHTLTAVNGASISTNYSKFGSGSLYVRDNQNDYITIPYSSDFAVGSNDFSFDCQVYFDDLPADPPAIDGRNQTVYMFNSGGIKCMVTKMQEGGQPEMQLGFLFYIGSSSYVAAKAVVNSEFTADTWHHVAYDKKGSMLRIMLDGEVVAYTFLTSSQMTGYNPSSTIQIAKEYSTTSPTNAGNVYINELRFVNGASDYPAIGFTPPTEAPTVDSNDLLVLNMEGSEGSRTFTDSSNTGRTVTVNGNARIVSSAGKIKSSSGDAPVGDNCALFKGSSYLTVPDSADWAIGTNDFTIELWLYIKELSSAIQVINHLTTSPSINGFHFTVDSNGALRFQPYTNSSGSALLTAANVVKIGAWQHIAISRSSGIAKIFVDGVEKGSGSLDSIGNSSNTLRVGTSWVTSDYLNGSVDELRISDTARYTGAFTPSTTAFTSDANTLLLMHFEDNFDDSSSYARTITNTDVIVGPLVPSVGTKMLELGDSVYLVIPASSDFDFDSDDYTIELQVYLTSADSRQTFFETYDGSGNGLLIRYNVSGNKELRVSYSTGGTEYFIESSSNALLPDDDWHHIALVQSSGDVDLYIDGVSVASSTTATMGGVSYNNSNIYIGCEWNLDIDDFNIEGYINEYRVSDMARYTGNFTPPTTAFTSDSNTLLLMNFETGYSDSSSYDRTITDELGLTGLIEPQVGTGMGYFDGAAYLSIQDSADFYFNTDDYTIEMSVFATNLGSAIQLLNHLSTSPSIDGFHLTLNADGSLTYNPYASSSGSPLNTVTSVVTLGWNHIVVVVKDNVGTIFVNGNPVLSSSVDPVGNSTNDLRLGVAWSSGYYLQGSVDSLRLSSVARYEVDWIYEVPTKPYSETDYPFKYYDDVGESWETGILKYYDTDTSTWETASLKAYVDSEWQ